MSVSWRQTNQPDTKPLQLLGYRESDFLRHSGMEIGDRLITVDARVLPPPPIQWGGDRQGPDVHMPVFPQSHHILTPCLGSKRRRLECTRQEAVQAWSRQGLGSGSL
jgi:Argonaute linker 2 domain